MKLKAILFIIIFFAGCALDIPDPDKLPVWSTTLEVPIIETKIDLITIDDSGETPRGYDLNLNFNATRLWHSQDLKEIRDENGVSPIPTSEFG